MVEQSIFFQTPARVLAVFVLLVLMVTIEIGFYLGKRAAERRAREEGDAPIGIGAIQGAAFGLFGLLLALTFSFVMGRVDARRQLAVAESNAIATAYLRFDVLPEASRTALRSQLREHVDQRVALARSKNDPELVEAAARRASELRASMWSIATAHVRENADAGAYLFVLDGLNDAFSQQTAFDAAMFGHLPPSVLAFLVLTATVAAIVAGYALGLPGRRHQAATACFVVLTTLAAYVILDLDRPQRGLFRAPVRALLQLQASMRAEQP